MRRVVPWLLALSPMLSYGCGDDSPTGGGGAGGSSTSSQGGGEIPCTTADECPASTSECALRVCENGVCGTSPVAAGTPAKTQVLEDCKRIECDGAGTSQTVPEDDDFKNDNNPCTADSCSMGMRVNEPLPVGTPCSETEVCDERGSCVECLGATECGMATECSTPTCEGGACGTELAPSGQPVAVQTAGDCLAIVCDGMGSTTTADDPKDVFDDSNPCTLDECQAGTPVHTAQPGLSCGANGTCNAQGQCVGCIQPSDCPGTDDFCKTRTCDAGGVCGFSFTAAGTDLPAAQQTSGDCVTLECNGSGLVQPLVTSGDLPIDGNECTLDQCIGGSPMNPPASQGAPCTMGGAVCNGMGACVDCNTPADCSDPPGACVVAACNAGSCGQENAPNGTVCAAASCSGGVQQLADTCQAGACTDGGSSACAPYVCGPSACTTSCVDSGGCANGATCDTGLEECTTGPTCTAYCNTIETNCTGNNDQYVSIEACLASCAGLPDGAAADTSGNTVGCRTYHAGAAMGSPAVHCPHAGPGGAGACGNNCDGFCTIALAVCTGPNQVYASLNQCMTECAGFPTSPPYSTAVTSGDSFACRLYHLTAASVDPAGHCSHIPAGSPVCN